MQRKLVKHGPSTLIVSLPSKWVKNKGLKAGDSIEISEISKGLLISSLQNKIKKECELNIDNYDRTSLILVLHAIYKQGITKVKLTYANERHTHYRKKISIPISTTIHSLIGRFIGYEIIEETSNSITISQVSTISKDEIHNLINRTILLMQDIVQSYASSTIERNIDEIHKIEHKHDTITKLVSYLIRAINMEDYSEKSESTTLIHILATVDKVADIFKYLARSNNHCTASCTQLKDALQICTDSFTTYTSLFRKFEDSKVNKISQLRDIYKIRTRVNENNCPNKTETTTSILQALELLYDLVEWRIALHIVRNVPNNIELLDES